MPQALTTVMPDFQPKARGIAVINSGGGLGTFGLQSLATAQAVSGLGETRMSVEDKLRTSDDQASDDQASDDQASDDQAAMPWFLYAAGAAAAVSAVALGYVLVSKRKGR
jgi:hypothetical protein